MLPNHLNSSTFSTSPASDPMLYGCTIDMTPQQLFHRLSHCILPFGFLSSGCSKLPTSMLYHDASGTPTRYIVGIYHVYSMHMYGGCIRLAYTAYIQCISNFHFHVFMRNSMLHTNDMVEDNIMLKPEMYKKAKFAFKTMYQTYLVYP